MAVSFRKLFSFAAFQAKNPRASLPLNELDAELQTLRKAVISLSDQMENQRLETIREALAPSLNLPPQVIDQIALEVRQKVAAKLDTDNARLDAALTAASRADAMAQEIRQAAAKVSRIAASLELGESQEQRKIRALIEEAKHAASVANGARVEAQRAADDVRNSARIIAEGAPAEEWAKSSQAWAEFLDGNNAIPDAYLTENDVTGDHWSARWWAHRAGEIVQDGASNIFKYYIGAYYTPPASDPNGDALVPGCLYYDLTNNMMMVWDGDEWLPFIVAAPADLVEFHYYAKDQGQTLFGGIDIFGKTPSSLNTSVCNVNVFLNGVRLTENLDWHVVDGDHIRIPGGAAYNSIVTIERFDAPQTTYAATAGKIDVNRWVFDGATRDFEIYVNGRAYAPANAAQVLVSIDGVMQDPGVDFTTSGNRIEFIRAPLIDAKAWGLVGMPIGPDQIGVPYPAPASFNRGEYECVNTGQTIFGGGDKNGNLLSGLLDTPNAVTVHVNGVRLESADYSVLSDTEIALANGVVEGSSVIIEVMGLADLDTNGMIIPEHDHDCGVFA